MATEEAVIESIRRRIADLRDCQLYQDEDYQDAIGFSLSKLSSDLSVVYSTIVDVPAEHDFLLVKLATIEMCYVRASATAEREGEDGTNTDITTISVPDLSVSDSNSGESRGTTYWMLLAKRLQSEYDGEIKHLGGAALAGQVTQGYLRRISLTHGGFRKRLLDPGLAAVQGFTALLSGSDVLLTWNVLLVEDFARYDIFRATDSAFVDEERVGQVFDNQKPKFTDESVASGAYFYRVKSVNPNELSTPSSAVAVTVP